MPVKLNKGTALGLLDLTPMIDMVFNLLIFFMVTTEFAKEDRQLDVALTTASSARALTAQTDDLFIDIDREGRFFVKGRIMAADEVEAVLRQAVLAKPGSLAVKIRPDTRGSVQATVQAFDLAARAGVKDASIVTGVAKE